MLPPFFKVTEVRIPKAFRSPALFYYELRHGEDWSIPETLEERVKVNFWGTLTTTEDILEDKEFVELSKKDKTLIIKKLFNRIRSLK